MNIFIKIFNRFLFLFGIYKYHFGFRQINKYEDYVNIHNKSKLKQYKEVDYIEEEYQFKINKNFFENLAFNTQVVIKNNEINYQHGRILYTYLSDYINKSLNKTSNFTILETGTARGFSSICMSRAIIDRNVNGSVYTIDILPHDIKMVWNCPKDFTEISSRMEMLSDWSDELSNIVFLTGSSKKILNNLFLNRVHFAFLDGLHTYVAVKHEFDYINKRQNSGDMIIFDDVVKNKYNGVVKLINELIDLEIYNVNLLRVSEFRTLGIAVKK